MILGRFQRRLAWLGVATGVRLPVWLIGIALVQMVQVRRGWPGSGKAG